MYPQVYFSYCPRDFIHLFCNILQGLAIRYINFVSSLNGFKFLYLEASPSGNEGGLSLLAMWIPVNSLIQDESNLHSSNAELSCVPPTLVIFQLFSPPSGMSFLAVGHFIVQSPAYESILCEAFPFHLLIPIILNLNPKVYHSFFYYISLP